jgi:hypothetical protein
MLAVRQYETLAIASPPSLGPFLAQRYLRWAADLLLDWHILEAISPGTITL